MSSREDRWLLERASNVTSQFGEDGIIAAALDVLPARDRWCVEFGAWDGKELSNTWNLVTAREYSAVLIEGSQARFGDLRRTYADNARVVSLNRMVGFDAHDSLDRNLAETAIPLDFDLLSVDIDGNDYHVWEATERYRPKLVIIEFNPTVPCGVEFVQPRRHDVMQGASLASLIRLGAKKGYELVATTRVNGLFVDSRYFPLFGIEDNSEASLRPDQTLVTHLFTGYDGRIFLRGSRQLPWHFMPFSEPVAQQLPWFLRSWFEDYGPLRRTAFRAFRRLRQLRLR